MDDTKKALMALSKALRGVNLTEVKAKTSISVNDWVQVTKGELRGAAGHVRSISGRTPKVVTAQLRQLNGNVLEVPVANLRLSWFDHIEEDRL